MAWEVEGEWRCAGQEGAGESDGGCGHIETRSIWVSGEEVSSWKESGACVYRRTSRIATEVDEADDATSSSLTIIGEWPAESTPCFQPSRH